MDHALIMWNIILEGNINKLKWKGNSFNKDNWTRFAFAFNMNVSVIRYENVPRLSYGMCPESKI